MSDKRPVLLETLLSLLADNENIQIVEEECKGYGLSQTILFDGRLIDLSYSLIKEYEKQEVLEVALYGNAGISILIDFLDTV